MVSMIDPSPSLYIRDEEAGESPLDSTHLAADQSPAILTARPPTVIAPPSDPGIPLTDEQLDALFAPERQAVFVRELFILMTRSAGDAQD